ncbi:MAG TPA: type II toxin-antitoxin system PemK/MazF family toxin [Epsilonproteobacteria bacterium]|nr:type II toxin-antitoxin system PemK/MazF family toxin [Campylobacterota bacterium]
MMVYRGEIWLTNLNPVKKNNEMGKIRPALVFQNDELNHSEYPTTIIIPLTTSLIDDAEPIRMRVGKREKLLEDSDLVITQIRSIDNERFVEKLASLTSEEMRRVKEFLDEVIL